MIDCRVIVDGDTSCSCVGVNTLVQKQEGTRECLRANRPPPPPITKVSRVHTHLGDIIPVVNDVIVFGEVTNITVTIASKKKFCD